MIKIAIQDCSIPSTYTDMLVDACRYLNLPYECFGIIPEKGDITGNLIDDSQSIVIPFGSVEILNLFYQNKLPKNWLIYHNLEAFSFNTTLNSNKLLRHVALNKDYTLYKFKDCADIKFPYDVFIKPNNDLKLFDGQILPANTLIKDYLYSKTIRNLYGGDLIITAKVKSIIDEFRVFVVNGVVVAKALYKRNGKAVGGYSYKFSWFDRFIINNLALLHQPDDCYVVDICTTEGIIGKNWHVLEYNALQCSGLYNCNAVSILKYLTSFVINEYNH